MKKLPLLLFSLISSLVSWAQDDIEIVNIENPAVRAYMADSTYFHDSNFTHSVITKYNNEARYGANRDWPAGKTVKWTRSVAVDQIQSICISVSEDADYSNAFTYYPSALTETSYVIRNNFPNCIYYYKIEEHHKDGSVTLLGSGKYRTVGQVRMVQVLNNRNVRDIGGWPTQFGVPVRYGVLYRSGSLDRMTEAGRHAFVDNMGVMAELDLRGESRLKTSKLGQGADYFLLPHEGYMKDLKNNPKIFARDLRWIIARLQEGKAVDWHCAIGCDRCGTVSLMIEGLLGLSEIDLGREYELSTFSGYDRPRSPLKQLINHVKTFGDPADLAGCFYNFWLSIGMKAEELDYFRGVLLGTPKPAMGFCDTLWLQENGLTCNFWAPLGYPSLTESSWTLLEMCHAC